MEILSFHERLITCINGIKMELLFNQALECHFVKDCVEFLLWSRYAIFPSIIN